MMWFGTEAGLAKFDGRRTQTLVDAQFPQGRVLSLHTDSNGWLWVGTDTGAARIIGSRVEAINNLKDQTINAIIEPEKGRLIMATEQGMIYECRIKSDGGYEIKPLLTQPLESADTDNPGLLPITSLTVAHDKLLAGSLSRGLLAIENGSAKEMQGRRTAFFIRSLETDTRGQLWIGTRARKNEPALRSAEGADDIDEEELVTGTVMALQPARNDDMWVGTEGNGAFYFPSTRKITRFTFDGTAGGLRSNTIFAIFIDREDVVWFGTDRGVSRYDPNAPRVETIGDVADSNFVRTLYQTSAGQVLAGTNRGLFVHDAKTGRWNSVAELSRNIIYCISEDKNGRLLVGSASGFFVGPKLTSGSAIESFTFSRLEAGSGSADSVGSIRDIATFRGVTYIASYGRGVERLEDNRVVGVWPTSGSGPREVISLHADGEDRLLVGTGGNGVYSFDGTNASRDDQFLPLNGTTVRSFDTTEDKTLWVATSQGVYFCLAGKECTPAAPGYEARSLANALAKNGNEVWCATTGSGLLKITRDEQLGPIVSQLDAEQGLPSQNVFASLPQKIGDVSSLLIGTSRGIARYTPAVMPPTLYASRVISKRVHAPNELPGGLYLEYPQNSLLLDVAAVSSRTFPEKFQYAFTLTDNIGRVIKQKVSRESQFPMEGLSAGDYRVTARAFSKDLVASEPMTFGLSVGRSPFPWTSTALAILLALALLALLWAILERRRIVLTSAALVAANRELAGARLDLANEAERERRRISRDLHDQTLADLRHLLLMSDQLPSNGDATGRDQLDPAVLRKEIESISQEVRRICEDLSPSVLQNVGFAAALEFALAHAMQDAPPDKRFSYEFECDDALEERVKFPPNVQMQIYRIVQEALNNICRHAAATLVKMNVTASTQGDFLLQITDDGRQFDHDATSAGRGLANMRARASLIGAEISWEKIPMGGTLFSLKLKGAPETLIS